MAGCVLCIAQHALDGLCSTRFRGVSTLVIAHRLSTIRHANVIFVMHNASAARGHALCAMYRSHRGSVCSVRIDGALSSMHDGFAVTGCVVVQGRVAEAGDHATLLARGGRYAALVNAQSMNSR